MSMQATTAELTLAPCRLGMPRIYLPVSLTSGVNVTLPKQSAQHLVRVLRLKTGAPLVIFNGQGGEFAATLVQEGHSTAASVTVGDFIARDAESRLAVQLAQGISRGERMDFTIQKAVELGVSRIIPLDTEFCGVNMQQERAEKRLAHWQGIAIAACEQCGRTRVPEILAQQSFAQWLAQPLSGLKLLFDPYARQKLAQLAPPEGGITILIGPEGGLSGAENQAAIKAGFTPVQLGPRMLRTETAPIAALAAVQTLWGDLG